MKLCTATGFSAAILATALLIPAVNAQEPSENSWDNLHQLRPGQRIEVFDMSLRSFRGDFVGYSDEAISLRTEKDEIKVSRVDVLSVKNRKRPHHGRNALIGLGVGFAGGLAFTAIAAPNDAEAAAIISLVTLPTTTFAGAVVGAALPPGKVTVYRAQSRNQP